MPKLLPRLRYNLDFLPSPAPDRPGLLIRDPYKFSETTLIIPPILVHCLEHFDGQHTDIELRGLLMQLTGELQVGPLIDHMQQTLRDAGFLDDEEYQRQRERAIRGFAEAPKREPAHAGGAYPDTATELTEIMCRRFESATDVPEADGLLAIAAPHVSPDGGWETYVAAYRALKALGENGRDKTFVVLGTSHYGEPERFGLTRKPFVTPFGETRTEGRIVDRLASRASSSVVMEDYCHAIEHSIEFQIVFLQHLFGPDIKVLPILCGPFVQSTRNGGAPERDEHVKRFLSELGEVAHEESDRLLWVLGVDMAHIGVRYGDGVPAYAGRGEMLSVAERDKERIGRIAEWDAAGYWDLVQANQDELKWCGSAPFYTFLKAAPKLRGRLLSYEQWNIDEHSVVSFAGMDFRIK